MGVVAIFVVLVASCACLYLLCPRMMRSVYLSNKIQGPSWRDIFTKHLWKFLSNEVLTYVCKISESYNYKPWGIWLYWDFVLVVNDPESVKEVYKNLPSKTYLLYETAARYIGHGIFDTNGDNIKRQRKIVLPSFRKNLVECHLPEINNTAGKLVDRIRSIDGKSIDFEKIIEDSVIHISYYTLTSGVYSCQDNRGVCRTIYRIKNLVQLRTMNPVYFWLVYNWKKSCKDIKSDVKALQLELKKVFDKEKCELVQKLKECPGFEPSNIFEFMLKAHLGMGDEELSEEEFLTDCLTFVIGSFETTAFTTHMCLVMFALHPDVQQRVFEEQDAIFGQSDRDVDLEDLSNMVYLEHVLKETMRLFPPAPIIGKVTEKEVNIKGLLLPEKCTVLINNMALNRNPESFQDPEKFDPDRFSPANSEGRHPHSFNPFSFGVRNCPGQFQGYMVMKTFVSNIVRNFRVIPGEGFKCMEDIKVKMTVSLHLRRPIALRLIARERLPNNHTFFS